MLILGIGRFAFWGVDGPTIIILVALVETLIIGVFWYWVKVQLKRVFNVPFWSTKAKAWAEVEFVPVTTIRPANW